MNLSQQLFLRILPTVIITITIIGGLAYRSGIREVDHIYDAQLISDANILWALVHKRLLASLDGGPKKLPEVDFNVDDPLTLNDDAHAIASAHMFRVWSGESLVIVSSNALPEQIRRFQSGFTDLTYNGTTWRVYTLVNRRTNVSVEIGEEVVIRVGLVEKMLFNLSFPLILLVPIIAVLIWYSISNGLAPIRKLSGEVRSRTPDDLSNIGAGHLPSDLMPLVGALNHLLTKLRKSLTLERRFSDLAAHQLRTPQAGIKLLLQLLARAHSPEEREALIKDLFASNERAMRMIEQLLRLARVSHQPVSVGSVDLHHVASAAVADFSNVLEISSHQAELVGKPQALVHSDETLIRLMFDNLFDNAIKYSPVGSRILVGIERQDDYLILSVSDSGPGIPPEHREAVFQRFNRLNATNVEGAGLGLPIVADIAHRLSVGVTLEVPMWGFGLKVSMRFSVGEASQRCSRQCRELWR